MDKTIPKPLKILWFILGGLILLWTLFFYVKMLLQKDLGALAFAIFFGIGIYAFLAFLVLTFLYYLIRLIIKWTKKKSLKQEK